MDNVLPFRRKQVGPPATKAPSPGEMGPDLGPYAGGFFRCREKVLKLLYDWSLAEHVDRRLIQTLAEEVTEMKP